MAAVELRLLGSSLCSRRARGVQATNGMVSLVTVVLAVMLLLVLQPARIALGVALLMVEGRSF